MLRRPERYATLLRVRRREEDVRAAAFARAAGAVRTAQDRRTALVELHDDAMRRAMEAASGVDVRAMEELTGYERHLTQIIGRTDNDIARLQEDRGRRRSEFEASHRRRKMIEWIIERAAKRWAAHAEREERKAVEATVSMRHAFRGQLGGDR